MHGPISPKLTEIDQSRPNGLKMTKWTEVDRHKPKLTEWTKLNQESMLMCLNRSITNFNTRLQFLYIIQIQIIQICKSYILTIVLLKNNQEFVQNMPNLENKSRAPLYAFPLLYLLYPQFKINKKNPFFRG